VEGWGLKISRKEIQPAPSVICRLCDNLCGHCVKQKFLLNGRMKNWKSGKLEEWKKRKVECWKLEVGRLEDWKNGCAFAVAFAAFA
jgi:hypothetical protein